MQTDSVNNIRYGLIKNTFYFKSRIFKNVQDNSRLACQIEYNEKLHFFFGNRVGDVWGKEEKEEGSWAFYEKPQPQKTNPDAGSGTARRQQISPKNIKKKVIVNISKPAG